MNFEPTALTFRDVRLNQTYISSFCITNPMKATVNFVIRPSTPRYTIRPNKIRLESNKSIVITVKLLLNHYPNISKAMQGQEDYLKIKSNFIEQLLPINFFLYQGAMSLQSRSPSPNPTRRSDFTPALSSSPASVLNNSKMSVHQSWDGGSFVEDLSLEIKARDLQIGELRRVLGTLKKKYPNLEDVVKAKVQEERLVFEEKSEQILKILKHQDETISILQEKLDDSKKTIENQNFLIQNPNKENSLFFSNQANTISSSNKNFENFENVEKERIKLETLLEEEKVKNEWIKTELELANQKIEQLQKTLFNFSQQNHLSVEGVKNKKIFWSPGNTQDLENGSPPVQQEKEEKQFNELKLQNEEQNERIKLLLNELVLVRQDISDRELLKNDLFSTRELYKELENEFKILGKSKQEAEEKSESLRLELKKAHDELEQNTFQLKEEWERDCLGLREKIKNNEKELKRLKTELSEEQIEKKRANYLLDGLSPDETRDLFLQLKEKILFLKAEVEGKENIISDFKINQAEIEKSEKTAHERVIEIENTMENYKNNEKSLKNEINQLKDERKKLATEIYSLRKSSENDQNLKINLNCEKFQNNDLNLFEREEKKEKEFPSFKPQPRESHLWWEYVWETLKTQKKQNSEKDNFFEEQDKDKQIQTLSIEIVTVKQAFLADQLYHKKEIETFTEQIVLLKQDINRLNNLLRIQQDRHKIQIDEKSKTIKIMSSRGDLQNDYAVVAKDKEEAKLKIFGFNEEIISLKQALEEEQTKILLLRSECASIQISLDCNNVLKTITEIPGIDPISLLEVMSGQLVKLRKDTKLTLKHLNNLNKRTKELPIPLNKTKKS